MEKKIRDILKNYLIRLKSLWWLGGIFVLVAIIFVVLTTIIDVNAEKNEIEDNKPEQVGVYSMIKLEWPFEEETKTEAYEAQINNARECGSVLCGIVYGGEFRAILDQKLKEENRKSLSVEDDFSIYLASYNVIAVKVFGKDVERVQFIEEQIKNYIEGLANEIYGIDSVKRIMNPYPMKVEMVDGNYIFKELIDDKPDVSPSIYEDKNIIESLLSMSNIIIVLSSFVLYAVIVLLISIANEENSVG